MRIPAALCVTFLASVAVAVAAPVTGMYVEDRTMRVYACPCEWSTDWAHRGREAVLAWDIQSGDIDGVALAGLRLAAVIVGDFSLTEADAPRRAALYVDSSASSAQAQAGIRWLRSRYRELLGDVVAVHSLPMAITFTSESVSVDAGSALSVRMRRTHLPEDAESWAQLIHGPFIRLTSSSLGTTSHVRYSGAELKIRWVRDDNAITGYFGRFQEM